MSTTFEPKLGDFVEAYDHSCREWRKCRIVAVPAGEGHRFTLGVVDGGRVFFDGPGPSSVLMATVFEMRPFMTLDEYKAAIAMPVGRCINTATSQCEGCGVAEGCDHLRGCSWLAGKIAEISGVLNGHLRDPRPALLVDSGPTQEKCKRKYDELVDAAFASVLPEDNVFLKNAAALPKYDPKAPLVIDRERFLGTQVVIEGEMVITNKALYDSVIEGDAKLQALIKDRVAEVTMTGEDHKSDPWVFLNLCVRCDNHIRDGMAGVEDHAEGCPGRHVVNVPPGHAMSMFADMNGKAWGPGPIRDQIAEQLEVEYEKRTKRELACFELLSTLPDVDPETPGRMARALTELTSGYGADLKAILKTFPRGDADSGIVIVRDIPFASVCEHHVLPFTGTATVAYLPSDRIVGLSKIPRLVDAVTRRLQVQERIGSLVADALMEHVGARGVMVVLKSRHTCMTLRGAKCPGEMLTSTIRGVFENEASARAEVLSLMSMK